MRELYQVADAVLFLKKTINLNTIQVSKEIKQRVSMAIETLLATMRKSCYGNLCKTKFRTGQLIVSRGTYVRFALVKE